MTRLSVQLRFSVCTIALSELGGEHGTSGGVKKSEADGHTDETVEVDTGPDFDCRGEGEDVERGCDEAEGELGDEPGEGVVVLFVGGGGLAVFAHEEGAYKAAAVFLRNQRIAKGDRKGNLHLAMFCIKLASTKER